MQHQSPEDNNPANPLQKVASLNIVKEYVERDRRDQVDVRVSLNFKKSMDLRGSTQTHNGQKVNVTFGMAIHRASLSLRMTDDIGGDLNNAVTISHVAHINTLAVQQRITNSQEQSSSSTRSAKARLKASPTSVSGGAEAGGEAGIGSSSTKKRQHKSKRQYSSANVRATYGPSYVHWEIDPGQAPTDDTPRPHLDGEVFQTMATGRPMSACHVRANDDRALSTITIVGSLTVGMAGISVENIAFTDDDGMEISMDSLQKKGGFRDRVWDMLHQNEVKERLLKQIIRKHLLDQGLNAPDGLVEISRANA